MELFTLTSIDIVVVQVGLSLKADALFRFIGGDS